MKRSASKEKPVKYLVCVDGRPESQPALKLACMKACARNAIVDMLHVISPADFQALGSVADRMREERHGEGQQLLNRLANDAATAYGLAPNTLLREGPIGEEIVAAAAADPEIIIIFVGIAQQMSGRGTLASWLAAQLGNKLLTPILMVPGNLTDEQLLNLV